MYHSRDEFRLKLSKFISFSEQRSQLFWVSKPHIFSTVLLSLQPFSSMVMPQMYGYRWSLLTSDDIRLCFEVAHFGKFLTALLLSLKCVVRYGASP